MSTKRVGIVEIILWILVVLLVLVSLTPVALGYKFKSDYAGIVNEFSELLQVDLQLQQYNQGLYSSEAVIAVNIPNLPNPILFREEIIHGPIYFGLIGQGKSPITAAVIKGQLEIDASQADMVNQIFTGANPVQYQNIVDFNGDIHSQAYIPAINSTIDDEMGPVKLQSAGVILNETYTAASRQLKGDVQMPQVKVQTDLFSMDAQSLSLSFSGSMGSNQLIIGDSVASMSLLNFDSGEDQFAMRDMTIRSVTSESGTLINSGAQMSAREILASNQKYGPAKFNISLNGLNAQSLLQLQQIQKQLEEKMQQGLPPEQINAMMTGQMMGLIPELIKQAEIKVNPLSVNSELGKLEADLEFMLEGIDQNTPADPMFLLGAISLDVNMSIDEQLLKHLVATQIRNAMQASITDSEQPVDDAVVDQQVTDNINGMVSENWLILNEGVYLSKISMHQGELLVNDQPLDPMQQIMSSMSPDTPAAQ